MADRTVASYGVGLDLLIGNFSKQLDGFLNKTAGALAGYGARLSGLLSLPIGLLGKQMGDMATEVDLKAREATALIAATFGDSLFTPEAQATLEKNYQDIIDRSLQLSIEFGEKASSIVESAFFAIGTGFPTLEEAFTVVRQATQAAAAGATDTTTALNVLIDVLNAYGLGADQAKYVSDVLFQTVNIGKVEFSELAQSLGDIIGIAPQLGVSLEEIGAILSTATKQGQSANLTLTGLRQVLLNVMAPRAAGANVLAEIFDTTADRAGLAVQQMIEMEGLLPTLQKVAQATIDPVTGRFDLTKAKQIFTRVEGLVRILPLFVELTDEEAQALTNMNQALDAGADPIATTEAAFDALSGAMTRLDGGMTTLTSDYLAMQKATQGAGATANAFSEVAKSLDRRSKQATAAIDALKIVIGLELKAALLPVIETIGRLVKTLIGMPAATKKIIAFAIIIATTLPVAILALSAFISVIGTLIGVVGGLVSFALNPFVLAIGFIVANLVKAKLATDEFADGMAQAETPIQKITQVLIALASVAADIFTTLAQHVANFIRFVARAVATVAGLFGAQIEMPDLSSARAEKEAAKAREEALSESEATQLSRDEGENAGQAYVDGVAQGVDEAAPELDQRFADLFPSEDETTRTFTTISRAAIRALLSGMSDADFDIFGDAVGLVEAEVNALGLQGEEAAAALQNAQVALAQALSGDAGGWETLRSIIGDSVGLIQEYVAARRGAIAAEQALQNVERYRREEIARLDSRIAEIRERIRQFELDTAEIPERFTRHRRRQLDEELNAAEQEKDARQKQLDAQVEAAKAQAEAAKAQAQHLAELLRMEQQLLAKVDDTTEASTDLENQLAAAAGAFESGLAADGIGQLETAFGGLGEQLNTLDLFFKGLMGQELDSAALDQLNEQERLAYDQGVLLRQSLNEIALAFMAVVDAAKELGSVFAQVWDAMPSWLQDALLVGGLVLGVGWKLVGGTIASLLGGALSGVGGLLLSGGKWVLSLGLQLAQGAASVLTSGFSAALGSISGMGLAAGGLWTLGIVLSIVAVKKAVDLKKEIEKGYEDTTNNWASFYNNIVTESQTFDQMLETIKAKRQEVDQIYESSSFAARALVNKEELFGELEDLQTTLATASSDYAEYVQGVTALNEQVAEIPEIQAVPIVSQEEFERLRGDARTVMTDLIAGVQALSPQADEAATAVGESLTEPIVVSVQEMSDELVGNSIIPDMIDSAITEFERLNLDATQQLTMFSGWVSQWGTNLLAYWYNLWDNISVYSRTTVNQMVVAIQAAMDQITASMQSMATRSTQSTAGMADDIVMASIIPDMVDQMLSEFNRMDAGAQASFGGVFGGMAAEALSGVRGVSNAMQALEAVPLNVNTVGPVGVMEQEAAGAVFSITNYWDAAITDKDRAEIEALSKSSTYEALVLAYGGAISEQ